jgi:hypothetical protein
MVIILDFSSFVREYYEHYIRELLGYLGRMDAKEAEAF